MATKLFSKKEAISHGFKMMKKYSGIILSICLIYAAFQIISGLLNSRAGSPISKESIRTLYRESAYVDNFYRYLEETGYINKYGAVLDK